MDALRVLHLAAHEHLKNLSFDNALLPALYLVRPDGSISRLTMIANGRFDRFRCVAAPANEGCE